MSKFIECKFHLSSLVVVNLRGHTQELIIRDLLLHLRDTFYVTFGLNGRKKVKIVELAGYAGVFKASFSDTFYQPAVLVSERVCFSEKNLTVNTLYNTH